MSCLHHFVALLPLVTCNDAGQIHAFLTQPGDGRTMFVLERVEPRGE